MSARSQNVVPLRPAGDVDHAPREALVAVHRHLERCKLSANTVKAYKRQTTAYIAWLQAHAVEHPDAFADLVGAEAAITAWRKSLMTGKAAPATINQALAAVTLLYAQTGLRIDVKRARLSRPGEPDALTPAEQGAIERASVRRGARDAAITARAGTIRLHGKGDQVRTIPLPKIARERITAWLDERGRHPGPLWLGQRGPMTISGIVQVVLAVGEAAGQAGLRPHRCRHTYATRLRQGGADPVQVQALLGLASIETAARYFRAGQSEQAAVIERVFE